MTEFELFQALRPFYPKPEYALLPQVASGTGSQGHRHADAIAMSLWPSRGLEVSGFEIKSYRGDWLREKANPAKAEEIAQYCNRWWIVAGGPFVTAEEIPDGWGLKVWDREAGTLKVTKKAQTREAKDLTTSMVAAILRKAQDVATPDQVIQDAKAEGYKDGLVAGGLSAARETRDLAELRDRLRIIEKKSGVKVDSWEPAENIGDALKAVLDGSQMRQVEQLRRIATMIALELGIEEGALEEESAYKLREIAKRARR